MTPELNRIIILRVNNVSGMSYPSLEEHMLINSTLQMASNIVSGMHHKTIIICDAENWNGHLVALLMSNFARLVSLLTVIVPYSHCVSVTVVQSHIVTVFTLFLQDVLSIRIDSFYLLNASPIAEPAFFLARKISKKLFQDRVSEII